MFEKNRAQATHNTKATKIKTDKTQQTENKKGNIKNTKLDLKVTVKQKDK